MKDNITIRCTEDKYKIWLEVIFTHKDGKISRSGLDISFLGSTDKRHVKRVAQKLVNGIAKLEKIDMSWVNVDTLIKVKKIADYDSHAKEKFADKKGMYVEHVDI